MNELINVTHFIFNEDRAIKNSITYKYLTAIRVYLQGLRHGLMENCRDKPKL